MKVTVTKFADGHDKCRVSPYDHSAGRAFPRSRSRSPTPQLSPVRTVQHEPTLSEAPTVVDGQDSSQGSEARDNLPDGQDTRLLLFLDGQAGKGQEREG